MSTIVTPRRPEILVVDDDEGIRAGIELLLADGPYAVSYRSDVSGAREAVNAMSFDLVITDLRLGNESGLDVVRYAKEADASLPVILMTSFSSMESAIAALRLGASEYIIKPFINDEFLHACT
ncbi:MAG: response regulator, partial [Usitatibacteraceae bacterium]